MTSVRQSDHGSRMNYVPTSRTAAVSSTLRDPRGTLVALLVGVALGLALAGPMLPGREAVPRPDLTFGPVGGYLLVGVLAITAIPICITLLYVFFAKVDQ